LITLGYALSSEEHKPNQLVAHAQMAEQVGFKFLLISDLPTPRHFEDVVEAIQTLQENGFDHIYLHQIGPDQEGFLKFFKSELYPLLEKEDVMKEAV